jgi:hypothetical protein
MLLSYVKWDEREPCNIDPKSLGLERYIKAEKIAAYRVTPPTLTNRELRNLARFPKIYAGNPRRREKYPCNVCTKIFTDAADACPAYFARGSEFTPLDRAVYGMRQSILEEHENDMMVYKLLYESLLYTLERNELRRSNYINVEGARFYYNFFDEMKVNLSTRRDHEGNARKIVEVNSIELVKHDPSQLLSEEVLSKRYRGLGSDARTFWISTVRQLKSIALYLVEETKNYLRPITLNLGIFARVENVEFVNNAVRVHVGIPSEALRFAMQLFSYNLRRLGCIADLESGSIECTRDVLKRRGIKVLAVETNVDLTYYDLRVLDLVYRNLLLSEKLDKEERDLMKEIEKYTDKIFEGLYESFLDVKSKKQRR